MNIVPILCKSNSSPCIPCSNGLLSATIFWRRRIHRTLVIVSTFGDKGKGDGLLNNGRIPAKGAVQRFFHAMFPSLFTSLIVSDSRTRTCVQMRPAHSGKPRSGKPRSGKPRRSASAPSSWMMSLYKMVEAGGIEAPVPGTAF